MDESDEIIEKFAAILQQKAIETPKNVYKDVNLGNTSDNSAGQAREIIFNVAKRIRELQCGEKQCGSKSKTSYESTSKPHESSINVNMLQGKIVPLNQLQTADHAAEVACIGVTQEFDTSFDQEDRTELPNDNVENRKNTAFHIIDISLKEADSDKVLEYPIINENMKSKIESQFDHCTQMLNKCIEIESIDQIDVFNEDNEREEDILTQNTQQRSPSPVFSVKSSKTKSKPPSPLVYDLQCFEKFENIAASIVDDSMDKNTAKQLINSQIINKELYLPSDESPVFINKECTSPVIALNADNFKLDSNLLLEMRKKYYDRHLNGDKPDSKDKEPIKGPETSKQIKIVEYEDEILFSSDEEDVCSYKYCKDLPFTCALETSFYDEESDILDKTMFVGFQTASDKSILVKADSFSKAKNIFDEVDGTLQSSTSSIIDLVQLEDKKISNKITNTVSKNDANIVKASGSKESIIDQHEDITSQPKSQTFKVLDRKDKHLKHTAISENIADSVLKESLLENEYPNVILNAANSIHEDGANSQHDTEDINKLDDEMLLEFQDEMICNDLKTETRDKEALGVQSEIGFKTASNHEISISAAVSEKSKIIMENINLGLKDDVLTKPNNLEANTIQYVGFSTASNKKINISEKALTRIKSVFHDIDLAKLTKNDSDFDAFEDSSANISSCVFEMAANKENEIYNEPLNEAKSVFRDIDKQISDLTLVNDGNHSSNHKKVVENNILPDEDTADSDKEPPFHGFDRSVEDETVFIEFLHRSQKAFENLNGCSTKISEDQTKTQNGISNHIDRIQGKALDQTNGYSSNQLVSTDACEGCKTNEHVTKYQNSLESRKPFQDFKKQISDECHLEDKLVSNGKRIQEMSATNGTLAKKQKRSNDRQKHAHYSGFQTANNIPIQVSQESEEETRRLFQDISYEITPVKGPEFKGFQTASNKMIEVSEQALKRSKSLFADIDNNLSTTAEELKTPKFTELKTTSKIQGKISKHALEKSRTLLYLHKDKTLSKDADRIECHGFLTASNKSVTISDKALEKSRKIFQNAHDEHIASNSTDVGKRAAFSGFQTASNKDIKISAKFLEIGRKLLQDLEAGITESYPKSKDSVQILQGFQTASNKKVEISQKALEKSRKLFTDFDDDTFIESDLKKLDEVPKCNDFQTASNKTVKISDRALAISRKLFRDFDAPTNSNQKQDDIKKLKAFHPASISSSKMSDQGLEKSKKLHNNEKVTEKSLKFSQWGGFHTANNVTVNISETALARTRKIFQNITGCEEEVSCTETNVSKLDDIKPNFSFITANNKKVDVSKQALLKTKALFRHLDKQSNAEGPIKDEVFEINTEVINDFETTFKEATPQNDTTPVKCKRSGSPILSCPKAKKRKVFKIPYSQKTELKEPPKQPIFKPPNVEADCRLNAFTFSLNYKKFKNYTLKDLREMEASSTSDTKIDPYILNFHFENILSFEFVGDRNDITDSKLTVTDLKNKLLNSVSRKLIPERWLDIQLKLIIWKLISYEITFPTTMNLTCTARNVMDQLKFRYDKELYDAVRPILRKIMERDEVSTRTLLLCVVAISAGDGSSLPELLLTDGWYTIGALTDKMLSKYVGNGKIKVGTKLLTQGAELVGSDEAVSPWEDTSSLRLKLFGNSTRRARWDARLGCHGNAAILSHLSDVTVEGGRVPKVRVLVTRVYPPLYVDKFEDGSTVTRSERMEHLHQVKYEAERQAVLDKIYEEVETEVDQDSEVSESPGCSSMKRSQSGTDARLAGFMKRATGTQFLSQLTSTQKERLEEYKEKRREKIMSAIRCKVQDKMAARGMNLNRNVVTVHKIRVLDIRDKRGSVTVTKAMLSIWRPNEAITEVIKENSWIEVLNITPTAFRYAELQLSAGRHSIFSQSKHKQNDKIQPYTLSLKRTCCHIKDLVKNPTMATDYNEIDTVGVVFQTDPSTTDFDTSKQPFQNVYLADVDKNIICVNFWGGLRKFGFENCLDTGHIIAGINLQKRAGNTRKSIPQFRVTEFSYFTKTPKHDIARKMIEELSLALSKIDKKSFLEECVRLKDNYSSRLQANENVSPYRSPNMDMNSTKTKTFLNIPLLAQKRNEMEEMFHLTGLDFESTFKQHTQQFSPKMLLKKRQVEQKMAKLKMYGEPPALSPIQIINRSKDATKAYKSPLISKYDVSYSVANKKDNVPKQQNQSEECDKIDSSPVICLNRTYVKKCDAKPVKLNFSKKYESCTDGFTEDFDCSPPLSLE